MHSVRSATSMKGSFLKHVFTGRLRTRNPVLLIFIGIASICLLFVF